jgi:hypothetical protein
MSASDLTPDRLVRLGFGFRESKTLLSAVELGVFTALGEGALDLDDLRQRVGIHSRGARDFFDALVSLDLLTRDNKGCYANTPMCAQYLDRTKPDYVGGELEFANARQFGPWGKLTEALRTGAPQSGARGTANYAAYYSDRQVLENVARGMSGGTRPVADRLAECFPWRDHNTLIDIGTAQGCLPVRIASAHAHITGGGFDLPPLRDLFETYVGQHGLSDRLRFFAGDFFADPLPPADVIVMGRVLHNWNLSEKIALLRKAYDALSEGGALIVYERLIDDERRTNTAGFTASLNMLVMTGGGFDFSGADCKAWMKEVGFQRIEITPLTAVQSMIVGRK